MSRTTSHIMTLHEYTALIIKRARELENDKAQPTLSRSELEAVCYDPVKIAKKEIDEKRVDLVICRTLSDGTKEEWHLNELERFI